MSTQSPAQPDYYRGLGRRKCAVARVKMVPGNGTVLVNGKPLETAFPLPRLQTLVLQAFKVANAEGKFNVMVKVTGGGLTGQASSVRHGIARALLVMDETLRPILRKAGLLTRDSRVKERKKYGLKRARKAPQYTKR
ncbi:MAG: 30S ribosomal protein S9 [Dehalococcoidia bacterium]|nr:30S ribosomal protein S9 [Dehalococcoidia bacterium]